MKTGKELLINDKFFENTAISKGKGEELYNTSPNPILKRYIDEFNYTQQDGEQIQKLINYCVVRYLKTDKQRNLMDNIKRWKYVNKTVEEYKAYFPQYNFNLKAFKGMKEELIDILFN
jgi:hypothetical protein